MGPGYETYLAGYYFSFLGGRVVLEYFEVNGVGLFGSVLFLWSFHLFFCVVVALTSFSSSFLISFPFSLSLRILFSLFFLFVSIY